MIYVIDRNIPDARHSGRGFAAGVGTSMGRAGVGELEGCADRPKLEDCGDPTQFRHSAQPIGAVALRVVGHLGLDLRRNVEINDKAVTLFVGQGANFAKSALKKAGSVPLLERQPKAPSIAIQTHDRMDRTYLWPAIEAVPMIGVWTIGDAKRKIANLPVVSHPSPPPARHDASGDHVRACAEVKRQVTPLAAVHACNGVGEVFEELRSLALDGVGVGEEDHADLTKRCHPAVTAA